MLPDTTFSLAPSSNQGRFESFLARWKDYFKTVVLPRYGGNSANIERVTSQSVSIVDEKSPKWCFPGAQGLHPFNYYDFFVP